MKLKVFVLLLVLTACFAGVYGLRCYKCSYSNAVPSYNQFCEKNFDKAGAADSIETCEGVCIKSIGEVFDVYGLERGCRGNATVEDCSNACGSYENASGCEHCCDTDLCNGATSMTFNLAASAAMMVFSFIC